MESVNSIFDHCYVTHDATMNVMMKRACFFDQMIGVVFLWVGEFAVQTNYRVIRLQLSTTTFGHTSTTFFKSLLVMN